MLICPIDDSIAEQLGSVCIIGWNSPCSSYLDILPLIHLHLRSVVLLMANLRTLFCYLDVILPI